MTKKIQADIQVLSSDTLSGNVIGMLQKSHFLFLLFLFITLGVEAASGDYKSVGTGNWSTLATWQADYGAGFVAATNYPGQGVGTNVVTIQDNNIVTLDVSPINPLGSLVMNAGANNSAINFNAGMALTVAGATTINAPTVNAITKAISVGTGSFTTNSLTTTSSGNVARDAFISLSSGTITVTLGITFPGANTDNYILFTGGAGTVFVGTTFTGGGITSAVGGGAVAPTSGTVNYNGAAQTIGTYTYFNLFCSGSGVKTLPNVATLINNNLDVTGCTLAYNAAAAYILTVTGNLSGNGTIDMSPGAQTHTLNLNGATNAIGTLTTAAVASTVAYNLAGVQTVFASSNYRNLTIAGTGIKTLQGNSTIGGNLIVAPAAATLNLGTTATAITINGNTTLTGGLDFGSTVDKTVISYGTFSFGAAGASLVMSGSNNHSLNLRGAANTFAGGVFTPGASNQTVVYDGDVAQTIMNVTYNNLTVTNYNGASVTARVKTLGASTATIGGILNITGLAGAPVTLELSSFALSVTGTTNINAYGILDDNNVAGANTFTGLVTVNPNGSWTSNIADAFTFQGGLSFNGTVFTPGTSTFTFNTNSQSVSGTVPFTLYHVSVAAGETVTNTNSGPASGLTISNLLSGAGNFTNTTILTLTAGANPLTIAGTIDFTTNPNTVIYNAAIAQTIAGPGNTTINFNNLTTSGARAGTNITLCNGATIGISGVFSPLATFGAGNYVVTNNTISYNGSTSQNIPALLPATAYNNLSIAGGSTKTLLANVTVGSAIAGILTLTSGVLECANFNLTLANLAVGGSIAVTPFSSTNMISTTGTGYLVLASGTRQTVYPIGALNYSPFTLTSPSPTATIMKARAVSGSLNPAYISKYWDIIPGAVINMTATFQYDPSEANSATNFIDYLPNPPGTSVENPLIGGSTYGANTFTVTGENPCNAGYWTLGKSGTYYSYQTGDWNNPTTWTSDPSGTLQLGNTLPGYNDNVVILSGRTVSISGAVAPLGAITPTSMNVTINGGGILDLTTFGFANPLSSLSGQGTLRLASAAFPSVITNTFVNTGGGTTEYYNAANFTLPIAQVIYNNLSINAPGIIATQLSNFTLNGSLAVKQGTYQINDNASVTPLTLTISGNVIVSSGASLTVGNGITNPAIGVPALGPAATAYTHYYTSFHQVTVLGDFTNNGTVRFTNLTYPIYNAFPPTLAGPTTGAASVFFRGATNNTLACNGPTDFYNLILDKGVDQTYSLIINASASANFRLFGANTQTIEAAATSNPNLRKALWIRTGTLTLQGQTSIPSLTEGTTAGATGSDYYIPANGALVIDGPDVFVLSTADKYEEVNATYGLVNAFTGQSNGVDVNSGASNASSIEIFGRLQINAGYLSTRESGGLITSNIASGIVTINGGTVDAKQFLSSTGSAVFTQGGGLFILRGLFQRTPTAYTSIATLSDVTVSTLNTARATDGITAGFGSFNLNNASNLFTMSGGTIKVYDVCDATAPAKAIDILASIANCTVTGGTIEIDPTAGTVIADPVLYSIATNAPFSNMVINQASGAAQVQLTAAYPLTVLNNLVLTAGTFNANGQNVTIGGNYSIALGTTYTTGVNTTIFNGTATQTFTVNLAAALPLNNLSITTPAGIALNFAGTQNTINILGNLTLTAGTLFDNGNSIFVTGGTVFNSGLHTGTGKISLNAAVAQTIDGNGIFQNLELNNTNAVSLLANTTVNGTLTLSQNILFNINTHNLALGGAAAILNASATRYILTAGNAGDGGITKTFTAASKTFTYPFGKAAGETPATIAFSTDPSAYGSINMIPINYQHPNVTVTTKSLKYFWRVTSSGFTMGAGTVTHSYYYLGADVLGTESTYVAAQYTGASWNTAATTSDVNTGLHAFGGIPAPAGTFLNNIGFIDGDYTAGDNSTDLPGPTGPSFGVPKTFYSQASGLWSVPANWFWTAVPNGVATTNVGNIVPGALDNVIIQNNDSIYLMSPKINPTASVLNPDIRSCANLTINKGSALDIGDNPGCSFKTVLSAVGGNGNIRLTTNNVSGSTFLFPIGDFTAYETGGGYEEFYSTNNTNGSIFILPPAKSSYGAVILSPLGGSNIALPNVTTGLMTINGDLVCRGQNTDSWLAMTWNASYGAINSKTVHVFGNLYVQGGSFIFYATDASGVSTQNIIIEKDVNVSAGAGIDIGGGSTTCAMSIGGSLINNSNNNKIPAGGWIGGSVRLFNGVANQCTVTFFGPTNASITCAGASVPNTILGYVIVNKGTSQSTTLTCDILGTLTYGFTDNWLTLQNGTFLYQRTNPSNDFTISTVTPFTIPATAGLTINYSNGLAHNVLISNAGTNNGDLYLNGSLTILNGNVYVGPIVAGVNNNDIEYSAAGSSAITIQGGALTVNGQIRRSIGSTNGILNYTQSGGSLTINGVAQAITRANFEVVNAGSVFNMSAGTITMPRGASAGANFGDLYLKPATSVVTGGFIIFDNTAANTTQTFYLDANAALFNLTVTSLSAAKTSTVHLLSDPLVLNGTLLLGTNTIFNPDKNVSIGVDLNNSGNYNYAAANTTTTFNGVLQNITGASVSNFYNLTSSPSGSVTVNNSFAVHGNLTIGSGNLVLNNPADHKITLSGNLSNNGTYIDNNSAGGGVLMAGASQQQISGSGSFGRLELNNTSGAITQNDISLNGDIVLTSGILDIQSNLFSLSTASSIGGAPFSLTKMIRSDGVATSLGLRKFFNTGANTFTYPVGVTVKYTPAVFTLTSNTSVGYLTVTPVNQYDPAVTDPTNVLQYYWLMASSGLAGVNGSCLLSYKAPTDVMGGPESSYVSAYMQSPGTTWVKAPVGPATDNVDEVGHTITFNYAGSGNLSGDYTCGDDLAIPTNMATYISIGNGNWNDPTMWSPLFGSPACPATGPRGCNVIINTNITMNQNNCSAYSTTITGNGTLSDVTPYFGHNLGTVTTDQITYPNVLPTTTPTLYLQNGNLPAGTFTQFMDCTGNGTLEYGGVGVYTIILNGFTSIPNLYFSGTGTRTLPNTNMTICHRLKIDGPTLDNSANNKELFIQGSMERYNAGTFLSGTGANATVSFSGSAAQTLGGITGNFTGTNGFNNLELNNSTGLTIGANGANGTIEINGNLLLTNGIITTTLVNTVSILNNSVAAVVPSGGTASAYVSGPLTKQLLNGTSFLYPIGNSGVKGHNFAVTSTTTASTSWTAEYFTPNPTATQLNSPLFVENNMEFWALNTTTAQTAKVQMGWDAQSNLNGTMTVNGISDLYVAEYNTGTSLWNQQPSTSSGTNGVGAVISTNSLNESTTPLNYSIATITNTRPIATLSPAGQVCGNAGIPVTFTSPGPITLPYTLNYTIGGTAQTAVIVNALPYTLPTATAGLYKLTGFKYNGSSVNGVVDPSSVNVLASPPTSAPTFTPPVCGTTTASLIGTAPGGTNTGLWAIIAGTGGTILSNTSTNTSLYGVLGHSYTVSWTISNGGCTSSANVVVAFPFAPTQPLAFTAAVPAPCAGSSGNVFTVPVVATATSYTWTFTGAPAFAIASTTNSASVTFPAGFTSGTINVASVNSCGTSASRSIAVAIPTATFSYVASPLCQSSANPLPTYSGGAVAGTFSSTPGLIFVSTSTGQVNLGASSSGTYTVTNTLCGSISATSTINILPDSWIGTTNNWFTASNWSCGVVPTSTIDVVIPSPVPNMPVINAAGAVCKNITINAGASVTTGGANNLDVYGFWTNNNSFVASNGTVTFKGTTTISGPAINSFYNVSIAATGTLTAPAGILNVAGNWTNAGVFNNGNGTVLLNGTTPQTMGGTASSTFSNLTVSNATGVTLTYPESVSGALNLTSGIVTTTAANILTLTGTATSNIGSKTAYVSGPMVETAAFSGVTTLTFPVGKGIAVGLNVPYRPAIVTVTQSSAAPVTYTAELFNTDGLLGPAPCLCTIPATLNQEDEAHYWQIDQQPGVPNFTSAFVQLYYDLDDSVTDYLNLRVMKSNGVSTLLLDEGGVGTANLTGSITSNSFSSFSRFILGNTSAGSNPLPVELLSFTAQADVNQVDLNWSTASETNNNFFTIERSQDGNKFEFIAKVPGSGTASSTHNYSTIDMQPYNGLSYYRLTQTDYNGAKTISKVVPISFTAKPDLFEVFPNPVGMDETTYLKFKVDAPKEILVVVYGIDGKEVYSKIIIVDKGNGQIVAMDPSHSLAAGVYLIIATSDSSIYRQRLIIK
jgi:hypothetical protein